MIPKKVHYCWFGGGEMPVLSKRCIESWKLLMPDFELVRWDEGNAPTHIPFVQDMLKEKKWAFASDFVRLYAIHEQGGIYLDTDMEVVQNLAPLLDHGDCFVGFESEGRATTGAMGGISGSEFVKACMELMEHRHSHKLSYMITPEVATAVLSTHEGLAYVYPVHTFYPYNPYDESKEVSVLMYSDVKSDTYAIHHWNHAWSMSVWEKVVRLAKRVLKV
ncbi:MAG: glycosyltransferase [Colwellia sp.]|jgi:Mannosyltransferase OCH1 and related enzymes